MPTTPLGVPHSVIRDDEYMGYKIPKDAEIIMNVWYVLRPFQPTLEDSQMNKPKTLRRFIQRGRGITT